MVAVHFAGDTSVMLLTLLFLRLRKCNKYMHTYSTLSLYKINNIFVFNTN